MLPPHWQLWVTVLGMASVVVHQVVTRWAPAPAPSPAPARRAPLRLTPVVSTDGDRARLALEIASTGGEAVVTVAVVAARGWLLADAPASWTVPWAEWEASGDPFVKVLRRRGSARAELLDAALAPRPGGGVDADITLFTDVGVVRLPRHGAPVGRSASVWGELHVEVRDREGAGPQWRTVSLGLVADADGAAPRWELAGYDLDRAEG